MKRTVPVVLVGVLVIATIALTLSVLAQVFWKKGNDITSNINGIAPQTTASENVDGMETSSARSTDATGKYQAFETDGDLTAAVDIYLSNDDRLPALLQRYGPLPDWNVTLV